MKMLAEPTYQNGTVAVWLYLMTSPAWRQSCSGGSGATGSAAIASRSCFSRAMRSSSEGSTHDGIPACGAATGKAEGGGGAGAAAAGMGGIAERCPANGCQLLPSKRHLLSSDTASFQRAPSQNQLPSSDHPVWAASIAISGLD